MFESIRAMFCKWTPWEERLLAALVDSVGHKHRDILRKQLEAVNKVQRILGWVEIDLYVKKGGLVCRDGVPKFFDDREFILARASTFIGDKRIQSELSCVGGYFFSSESNARIKPISFRRDIQLEIYDVDRRFV